MAHERETCEQQVNLTLFMQHITSFTAGYFNSEEGPGRNLHLTEFNESKVPMN